LQQIAGETVQPQVDFTPTAEALLKQHTWPGNVRELNNVIERTMATLEGDRITSADLPFYLHRGKEKRIHVNVQSSLLKEVVAKAEKTAIQDALRMTQYNKVNAAELLGIHRTLLYKKARKYNISLIPAERRQPE
jgi:DNA-binding NtrC family response regulator